MAKFVSKIGIHFLFGSIILASIFSCDSEVIEEKDIPNKDLNCNIEGCQYPIATSTEGMTLEEGTFFVVNNAPAVYQIFGYSFKVACNGKIKKMGIKVPEATTYTIRIYDENPLNDDVLVEASVTVEDLDWNYVNITPLQIDTSKTYIACVYMSSKLERLETKFYHIPDYIYPKKIGDITIKNIAYEVNQDKIKPVPALAPGSTILNGLVDFCFEED